MRHLHHRIHRRPGVVVVQGWTVGPLARRLGLVVPQRIGPLEKVQLELPGSAHHELLAYTVAAGSPVARGERIPRWARPSLVVRDGRSMKYQDSGRPIAGDHAHIFVSDRYPRLLDRLFASRGEVSQDDVDFFGAFTIDPSHSGGELEATYSPGLSETEKKLSISQLIQQRLGGRVEYADRLTLGPIELIVRDVDEAGRILSVGVSFEPSLPECPHTGAFSAPANWPTGFARCSSGCGAVPLRMRPNPRRERTRSRTAPRGPRGAKS